MLKKLLIAGLLLAIVFGGFGFKKPNDHGIAPANICDPEDCWGVS